MELHVDKYWGPEMFASKHYDTKKYIFLLKD